LRTNVPSSVQCYW